jgi:hypothetical protein
VHTGSAQILLRLLLLPLTPAAFAQGELWLTDPGQSALFQKQSTPLIFSAATNEHPTIQVDDSKSFQTMDGFGFTLTGGSAPDRRHVLTVLNNSQKRQTFNISHRDRLATPMLNGNAVGTFVWLMADGR